MTVAKVEEYQVSLEVHDMLRRVKIFVCRTKHQSGGTVGELQVVLTATEIEFREEKVTKWKMCWPNFKLKSTETLVMELDENGSGYVDCQMADSGKLSFYQFRSPGQSHDSLFNPTHKSDSSSSRSLMEIKTSLESKTKTANVSIACAACKAVCHEVTDVERVLPLPSVAWKDDSQDWFCACTKIVKRPEYPSDLTSPRGQDIFYAESFVTFDAQHFPVGDGLIWNDLVKCGSCALELGICDPQRSTVMMWTDLVLFSCDQVEFKDLPVTDSVSGYETVFKRLVGELMKEVKFLSGKVCLQNVQDPKRSIKMHTMRSSAKFYQGLFTIGSEAAGEFQEMKARTPVLYCKDPLDTSDCQLVFKVNQAMIKTATDYLRSRSDLGLPQYLHFDPSSQMSMSYIDLL